jgi:hypothetical protein
LNSKAVPPVYWTIIWVRPLLPSGCKQTTTNDRLVPGLALAAGVEKL